MVSEELLLRLNDSEYKNWLKAGRCLLILKSGLHPFTSQHMRGFHRDLLTHSPGLRRPCETNACRPRGNKVIQYRNDLMHSCELRMKDEWMRRYQTTLKHFVRQFSHVPQMATVGKEIDEMLTVDLSVCVSGLDQMDAATAQGLECDSFGQSRAIVDLVSQWETELLQEKLQELLHTDDDEDAETRDTEQLKRLGGFLQANRDLGERFSAELQAIDSLQAR
nr:PREDICTED: uncharacterized protein CXorf38 homolog [Paralichthys olivaceus]